MPLINLFVDGDGCWKDLPKLEQEGRLINVTGNDAPPIQIAGLRRGMASGASSVMIRIDLPDGRTVIAETSLALLGASVDAIRTAHGSVEGVSDVN
jgi:hypothetical protein